MSDGNDLRAAARILGARGGRAGSDAQRDARRRNAKRAGRPTKAVAATIEQIREIGRQHDDLALAADARLWRRPEWRLKLSQRVRIHDAKAAEGLEEQCLMWLKRHSARLKAGAGI